MRPEAKVGLFVLLGIAALLALSTRISSVANFGREGYRLYAEVPTAAGLEINSVVRVHGVAAGYLESMIVEGAKVKLTLFIFENQKIAADSTMIISQETILGGSSINLISGGSTKYFSDGDRISRYKRRATIDEAVDQIDSFVRSLNEAFDGETRGNLKSAIASLKNMGDKLGAAGEQFRIAGETINEKLPKIIDQIDSLTAEFNKTGADINAKLPEILQKFSKLEDDLIALVGENKKPLNETIASVKNFFEKGSDTLESFDNLLGKAEKAELQVDMFHNRLLNDGFGESEISVAYLPNPTNYYMLGVTSASIIDKYDPNGDPRLPKKHDDSSDDFLISAQLGKRYENFLFRGGLIRHTGGVRIDYFSDDERLKLSLEAYDFNAYNDIRGDSAHLRFTARYLPWKYISIYGGYDNFLNSKADNFFLGAGVRFVDDDLKYLLLNGAASMAK